MGPAKAADAATDKAASHARRDQLLAIQRAAQKRWAEAKVFECDAPDGGADAPEGKFFANFPYPYMNGVLHLGHAFSVSKCEFACAFHRLCGKRVLFPQGFHCTGMPIKACADRLKNEIAQFGNPPRFPEEPAEPQAPATAGAAAPSTDPTAFKGTKSKAAAKKGSGATQWDILRNSGIPEDEIHLFQDPLHWLQYFPPLAQRDLTSMGCGIDWRRAFITTDANPYYDSFVRWQLTALKERGKVVKDKRFAVYSPKDGQPCADHDRTSGEGVNPQEYTLIKMEALELPGKLADLRQHGKVFFMAATLRPETMYGQTNCWVLPDGEYGAFAAPEGQVYVMCRRAAWNLCHQDKMPEAGALTCLGEFTGRDLIGTPLAAPRCAHARIFVLPLLTILMTKGTGVVTSVPSDSPTDYIALQDLKKKAALRQKFGVADEWVLPFDVVPIIDIPGFGTTAAVKVCEDLKIQSQNDEKKLEEAKGLVYLKGFTDGVMAAGPFSGEKVAAAKPKIRQELLDAGEAVVYAEPEGRVVSRSDDECVVALTDQWYITYGEPGWRAATETCLSRMRLFDETVEHGFAHTLGWLRQWACSRSFGLGTRLPWDPEFLIESLSDSTLYMAYYTVAHILQQGDMYGEATGGVRPEDVTAAVWDAVILGKAPPDDCAVPEATLRRMRDEFDFWYPFDLRCSGKDLINNHLTFCLYNHTALLPEDKWPRGMRTNGHLMLNSEKMSKSTGNFKTLRQAIETYSADAMRMALADASDSNDDGNFEDSVANKCVLRLTRELAWIEEALAAPGLRAADSPHGLADRVFANAVSHAAAAAHAAYEGMLLREALKHGVYDLHTARDTYRQQLGADAMHAGVVRTYIDTSVRLLAPIAPHWADHVWREVLRAGDCVLAAGWPDLPPPDAALRMAAEYVDKLISRLRSLIDKKEAPPKKKKADAPPPPKVAAVRLYVAARFEGWRADVLASLCDSLGGAADFKDAPAAASAAVAAAAANEDLAGKNEKAAKAAAMPFIKFKVSQVADAGAQVLDAALPFDEAAVLRENLPHIQRALGVHNVAVHSAAGGDVPEGVVDKDSPLPSEPKVVLDTEAA